MLATQQGPANPDGVAANRNPVPPEPAAGDSRRPARRVIVSGMTGYRACHATETWVAAIPAAAEFRVLGPSEVIAAGRPVPVSPGEQAPLLFFGQLCPHDLLFAAP